MSGVKVDSTCPYGGGWRGEHNTGTVSFDTTRHPKETAPIRMFVSSVLNERHLSDEDDHEESLIAEVRMTVKEAREMIDALTEVVKSMSDNKEHEK